MPPSRDELGRVAALATPAGVERRAGLHAVLSVLGLGPAVVRCGRFELIDKLGEGAMGVVWRARDPELGREVAIKLLRVQGLGEGSRASAHVQLRAEARALAKLSDPNVVQVLGAGREGDTTWIAMELVRGTSLAQWSAATTHGPARTGRALALLAAAARGLAAAHRVGLVHRDFKPANVMVTPEGSAKVTDFGLALALAEPSSVAEAVASDDAAASGSGGAATRWVGTPRYMAPEQWYGMPVDARADQFAFGLSAWEVLAGASPLPDGDGAARLAALAALARDRGARRIPPRLRPLLRRAMAVDPADRFASMDALLQAWTRATAATRRTRPLLALAVSATVAITVALVRERASPRCDGAVAKAAFTAIWNPARRDAIAGSLRATQAAWAESAIARVDAVMDATADAWIADAKAPCTSATDDAARDRQARCLARAAAVGDAWLRRLDDATPQLAERALATALPLPDDCALGRTMPDDGPLQRRLAEADAALLASDHATVAGIAARLLDELDADTHPALRSQALTLLARANAELGDADVEPQLAEAHALAIAEDAPALAFAPAIAAAVRNANAARMEPGRTWLRHAEAAAARLPASRLREAELGRVRCALGEAEGALEPALQHCESALAQLGEDTTATVLRDNLRARIGGLHRALGHDALALAIASSMHEQALRELGPTHPRTGGMALNLGTAAAAAGEHARAEAAYLQAAEIFRGCCGEHHRWVVSALLNLSALRHDQRDWDGAATAAEAALAACDGRQDAATARVLHNLAEIRRAQGDATTALQLLDRVTLIEAEVLPADHPQLQATHHTRGNVLMDLGRLDEAAHELARARALRMRSGTTAMAELERSEARLSELRAAAQP